MKMQLTEDEKKAIIDAAGFRNNFKKNDNATKEQIERKLKSFNWKIS